MAYLNGRLTLGGVAGVYASVDDALSDTSENPVQNKVITNNACLKADVVQTVTPSTNYNNENPISAKAVHTAIRANAYLASGGKNGTVTSDERTKVSKLPTLVADALGSTLVMTKNSFYNGGALSSNLELTLPKGAYGDTMQLDCVNGSTAYTVSINGENSAPHTTLSFTASANTVYSIFFSWGYINAGTQGWRIETKTFDAV